MVKNTGLAAVAPGEFVSHDWTVANTTQVSVTGVRLLDVLPVGFRLKKGSVRLNGVSSPDPVVSTDGNVFVFTVGDLAPSASSTISFMVEITADSPPGKVVNAAAAVSGDGVVSNTVIEIVTVNYGLQPPIVSVGDAASDPVSILRSSLPVQGAAVTAPSADTGSSVVKSAPPAAPSPPASGPQPAPPIAAETGKYQGDAPSTADPVVPETRNIAELAGMSDGSASSNVSGQLVPPDPGSTLLQVAVSTNRETFAPGESVGYELKIANVSKLQAVPDVSLMDLIPAGFRFQKGSAQLNGIGIPDPALSADGRALTFAVGNLAPGASSTISFEALIDAGCPLGKAVNAASAFSSSGTSNIAKVTATITDAPQHTKVTANIAPAAPAEALLPSAAIHGAGITLPVAVAATTAVPAVVPPVVSSSRPPLPTAPEAADAAAGSQSADTAVTAVPSPETPSQPELIDVPDEEEIVQADDQVSDDLAVQKTQSLSELIGKTDISVLSDVDGQFVKNMAENQTLENESASQVDETNLLESIHVGRSFNRESRAALARTEQANAQTGQAFALLLPSLSVRANYGSETSEPSMNPDVTGPDTHARTDASLSIRQPLFDLPSFMDWRRRKVIEQARGESYRVSDGDAYISAVSAYLSIVSSRLQTDMTREFEAKLNDLLIYVEKRAKAGAASHSDMARVRARSQATLSSRLEQESSHAAAGIEFIRLTNLVPRKVRLPSLNDIGASLLPKTLDSAVATAMKSNPEITALAAEIEAAEIDKLVVKGRYLPRIDAEYTNSYSLHAGGNTSSAGQKDQRIMAVLNWTLFSGGSDYKGHVERTARHKELQYRLDDQRRRVVQTLSANYATLATTRERIASGYQELKSISTAADAMSKRMLSGNQSLLDMLDVYDRLYQVRSRLVSLHILEMSTAAQLVRLMQGTPGAVSSVNTKSDTGLQSK